LKLQNYLAILHTFSRRILPIDDSEMNSLIG
jgi:hypothetical protein